VRTHRDRFVVISRGGWVLSSITPIVLFVCAPPQAVDPLPSDDDRSPHGRAPRVAYDRKSHVGRLDEALDAATAKDWTVVDMQRDWKRVFAFDH